jgi:hypothetical protein
MSEQYPDLGITQNQDGDYWDVVIPDLDCSTDYALQAAWVFSDKSLGTSEFSDRFNFRTPGPRRTCPINVVAVWDNNTADLKVSWEKPFLEDNVTRDDRIRLFQLTLTAAGEEPIFVPFATKTGVSQYSYTLSQANNMANFGGVFQTTITGKITSIYGDGSSDDCPFTVPVYVDPICVSSTLAPTVVSADSSIIVSWQDPATKIGTYRETRVYVSETPAPYNWVQRYTGFGPASITLYTLNTVYVKLNHLSDSGCQSIDSPVVEGKAYDQIVFDDVPPDPVVNPSAAWNVRDLDVSFTMPALNLPSYVIVHLTSGTKTRSFEYPVSAAASATTSVKITRSRLIDAFGNSPSSFSGGYVTDLDIYRNENTTQVAISGLATAVKPNPLSGVTTTISVTALSNGYSVSSNLNSSATGIKIYQSSTQNGTYSLVASSNSSPVIVYDEVNAGNIVWVKGQWTCEEGLAELSTASPVLIIDVASLSLIENPVKIKTDGSIFAGTLDSNDNPVLSGARMLINKRGLFLYDSNDLNGTNPTTQIIGEDNGITATFITKKAKIANWIISENKFENVLTSPTKTFTGLSPSGTYAFWAGGGVSGGYSADANEDAKFSVTSAGYVKARDIHVTGGTIKVGDNFEVDTDGLVTAVDAELSGVIKASSGILGSMDIGGTIKVNGVDTVFPGQLRVTVPGSTGGKVEIGQLTTVLGNTVGSGIQVTNTTNGIYAQLDPVNGIIAKKGSIGGWAITDTSINNGENIGFYNTTTLSDIAIWAGGNRAGTPGPNFSVTYGGSLIAKEATLSGSIEARSGYFGLYDATSKKITSGWKINGKFLESFIDGSSTVKVKLDGLQGTIAGGNIVGSNVFFWNPTNWYQANTGAASPDPGTWNPETGSGTGNPGNIDYISSSGNFRLANGNLTYNGTEFKVKTDLVASNVFLGSTASLGDSANYLLGKPTTIGNVTKGAGSFSLGNGAISYTAGSSVLNVDATRIDFNLRSNNDGTAGDQTVVQDADTGELTVGRAFFYAGNNYPDGKTDRSEFAGGDQGSGAFSTGDIILSRKP